MPLLREADTAALFLYSRIKEHNQTTPVLIDSEYADVVVTCAYAVSINGKLATRCKLQCKGPMLKRIMTECDVASSFFGVGKRTVWK